MLHEPNAIGDVMEPDSVVTVDVFGIAQRKPRSRLHRMWPRGRVRLAIDQGIVGSVPASLIARYC